MKLFNEVDKTRISLIGFYFNVKFFFHVAEGSDFLKRGSTHPPSFPMSPPLPPPSPELKMDFDKSRCPPTSQGNHTPVYYLLYPSA